MSHLSRKNLLLRLVIVVVMLLVTFPLAIFWGDDWVLLHREEILAWWPRSGPLYLAVHLSIFGFYFAYAALALYALWRRRADLGWLLLCYILAQLLISALLARLLKMSIGRPRPAFAGHLWSPFAGQAAFESLPSGHSTDAAVGAGIADYFTSSRIWRALAFALLIVTLFARIVEGKHYPSDVLAGAALGYLGSLFFVLLLGLLRQRFGAGLIPAWLRARSASQND